MKINNIIIALLAFSLAAKGQGIILNAGDSYTYEFSNLPDYNTTQYVFLGAQAAFSLDPSSLSPGYQMRFEVFENSVSDTPLFSSICSASNQFVGADLPGDMLDLQGVVRFTMLAGSARVAWFDLAVFKPLQTGGSDVYFQQVVPTPEPSVIALVTIGALSIRLSRHGRFGHAA